MPKNNNQSVSPTSQGDDSSKVLAALSYPIWIISIISIAMAKDNKDLKYHGFQALFWGVGAIILYFVLMIIMMIPFLGIISMLLIPLIWICWLVCSILFAVKAYKGEKFQIPLIYSITKSIVKDID